VTPWRRGAGHFGLTRSARFAYTRSPEKQVLCQLVKHIPLKSRSFYVDLAGYLLVATDPPGR